MEAPHGYVRLLATKQGLGYLHPHTLPFDFVIDEIAHDFTDEYEDDENDIDDLTVVDHKMAANQPRVPAGSSAGGQFGSTGGGAGGEEGNAVTSASESQPSASGVTSFADLKARYEAEAQEVTEAGYFGNTYKQPITVTDVTLEVYRVGSAADTPRGIFFASDRAGADSYQVLHEGSVTKKYMVTVDKVLVAGHQNSATQFLLKKSYQDVQYEMQRKYGSQGANVANSAFDKKIMGAAKKLGFKGIVYTRPAPPADMELHLFSKKGLLEIKMAVNQPRVPAGSSAGGQFGSTGGGAGGGSAGAGGQTDTAEFRAWFGDSKVVDADGNPQVVYHGGGTYEVFDHEFLGPASVLGPGFYFTSDPAQANEYAQSEGGAVKPAFISIQNPMVVHTDIYGQPQTDVVTKRLPASTIESLIKSSPVANPPGPQSASEQARSAQNVKDAITQFSSASEHVAFVKIGQEFYKQQYDPVTRQFTANHFESYLTKFTAATGYDGIISGNMKPKRGSRIPPKIVVVAFQPQQIKSSIGNSGAFDPTSRDITKMAANQPRVPAGSSAGGQFGSTSGAAAGGGAGGGMAASEALLTPTTGHYENAPDRTVSPGNEAAVAYGKENFSLFVSDSPESVALANYTGAGYGETNNLIRANDGLYENLTGRMEASYLSGPRNANGRVDNLSSKHAEATSVLEDKIRTTYSNGLQEYKGNPRTIDASESAQALQHTSALARLVDNAPALQPTVVYRGVGGNSPGVRLTDMQEAMNSGGTVKLNGFTSTSLNPHVAHDFSDNNDRSYVVAIVTRRGLVVNGGPTPGVMGESEVIIPHGTTFKVHAILPAAPGTFYRNKPVVQMIQVDEPATKMAANQPRVPAGSSAGGQFGSTGGGGAGSGAAGGPSKQTDTAEFKAWFGDSKVVDADGNPVVVFHGTHTPIGATESPQDKSGIFFSSDADVANAYAVRFGNSLDGGEAYDKLRAKLIAQGVDKNEVQTAPEWQALQAITRIEGSQVAPVYLKISNPLMLDGNKAADAATANRVKDLPAEHAKLKAQGYDGIIIHNVIDRPVIAYTAADAQLANKKASVFVVFSTTQIKSSIGNSGAFDPTSRDITKMAANQPRVPAGSSAGGQFGSTSGSGAGAAGGGAEGSGGGTTEPTQITDEAEIEQAHREVEAWPNDGSYEQNMARELGLASLSDALAGDMLPAMTYVKRDANGKVVGVSQIDGESNARVTVIYLAVSPANQGQGLGRQMMAHAAEIAVDQGKGITLSPTGTAVPFYKKLGMKSAPVGARDEGTMSFTMNQAKEFYMQNAQKAARDILNAEIDSLEPISGLFALPTTPATKMAVNQPRVPAGSSAGGQFGSTSGAAAGSGAGGGAAGADANYEASAALLTSVTGMDEDLDEREVSREDWLPVAYGQDYASDDRYSERATVLLANAGDEARHAELLASERYSGAFSPEGAAVEQYTNTGYSTMNSLIQNNPGLYEQLTTSMAPAHLKGERNEDGMVEGLLGKQIQHIATLKTNLEQAYPPPRNLRDKRGNMSAGMASQKLQHVAALAKVVDGSPELTPTVVFRGVGGRSAGARLEDMQAALDGGATVKLNGFVSTSLNPRIAHSFASDSGTGYVMAIVTRRGLVVNGGRESRHSETGYEAEIIIPHGLKYKVHRIINDPTGNNLPVVQMIQIDSPATKMAANQPRVPAGSSAGGQFGSTSGSGGGAAGGGVAGAEVTLMHGTSYGSGLKILEEGFLPGEGGFVYATPKRDIAVQYGFSQAQREAIRTNYEDPDAKFAVVTLKTSIQGFAIDNPSSFTDTWQWTRKGPVQPSEISRVEVFSAWDLTKPVEILLPKSLPATKQTPAIRTLFAVVMLRDN